MVKKEISFVVPCYNEGSNISLFYEKVRETFGEGLPGLELIFVDDGSGDDTGENLIKLHREHPEHVKVIRFSRNFGKEAAMLAGLEKAAGKYTVIIDSDLQQNPAYVLKMREILEKDASFDVVCCVQDARKEGFLSRLLKGGFYRVMNALMDVDVRNAASDFRLMRRCVVDAVLGMKEKNRFSKGIFAWIGFKTFYMPYDVEERASGASKWGLKKLSRYAVQGIVSFSDRPLLFSLKGGLCLLALSLIGFIALLITALLNKIAFSSPLFLVDAAAFFTSLILISNGLLGRYLASVFSEVKDRPLYIVKEYLGDDQSSR